MEPVDPRVDPRLVPAGSQAVLVAEHQDEFITLPSIVTPITTNEQGQQCPPTTITRWTLSDAERLAVLRGEDIYVTIVGVPIRPFYVTVGPVDWSR